MLKFTSNSSSKLVLCLVGTCLMCYTKLINLDYVKNNSIIVSQLYYVV